MRTRYANDYYIKSLIFAVSALLLSHSALAQNTSTTPQEYSGPCSHGHNRIELLERELSQRNCSEDFHDGGFCDHLRVELANAQSSFESCSARAELAAATHRGRRGSNSVATRRNAQSHPVAVAGASSHAPSQRPAPQVAGTPSVQQRVAEAQRDADQALRAVDAATGVAPATSRSRARPSVPASGRMTADEREAQRLLRSVRTPRVDNRGVSAMIAAGTAHAPLPSIRPVAPAPRPANAERARVDTPSVVAAAADQPISRVPAPANTRAAARARQLASMLGAPAPGMRERNIGAPTAGNGAAANVQVVRSLTELNETLRSGSSDSRPFQQCVSRAREMACYFGLNTNFSCGASDLGIVSNRNRSDSLAGLQEKWQRLHGALSGAAEPGIAEGDAVRAVWRSSRRMDSSGSALQTLLQSLDQPSADPAVRARQANQLRELMSNLAQSSQRITENRNQSTNAPWFGAAADLAFSSERARGYQRGSFNFQVTNEALRACQSSSASDDQIAVGRARDSGAPRAPARDVAPGGSAAPASGSAEPAEGDHIATGA